MFSDRINRIQPSLTLQMTSKATELRSKGHDVINMSVGEPDFNTPKNIRDAGIEAINNGVTRYTPGAGMSNSGTIEISLFNLEEVAGFQFEVVSSLEDFSLMIKKLIKCTHKI